MLFCLIVQPHFLEAQKHENLNLKEIWYSPTFYAKGISGIKMIKDGDYYAKSDFRLRSNVPMILKYSFESEKPIDTLFDAANAQNLPKGFNLEDYEISDDGSLILLQTNATSIYRHSKMAEFYVYNTNNHQVKKVFNGNKVFYATFSPQADKIAFVYNNDLYYQILDNDSVVRITKDGELNKIINGKSDWVYEEEFVVVKAFAWSPKGDRIAYYRFDESKVKEYEIAVYDSLYPTQYKYKYPVAGEANSEVGIWVYNLKTAKSNEIPIGKQNDQYIPRIKWTSDNEVLAITRLNRLQNHLELLFANTSSIELKRVYEEKTNTYIEINDDLYFLPDNSFILSSDKDGYKHLYLILNTNEEPKKEILLTSGNYDVDALLSIDESNNTIYFTALTPTPMERNIFKMKLDGKEKQSVIPDQKGRNMASFSSNNKYFILTTSTSSMPTKIIIYNAAGEKVRVLEDNSQLQNKLTSLKLPQKEFFTIPINDSLSLNAWMMKPTSMKKKKKYPVLISIYGGPGSQTVKDEWGSVNDIYNAYLVSKGVIVVSVDNRGTGGRGAAFRKLTYKNLGILESDDYITSAKWLAKQEYIDGKRIGIFGWSYGGYMSLMSLMRGSDVFKMAVSVAPVTDWRFYDNIYTERYMQRPIDNSKGYVQSSVFDYVPLLKGDLLLIHGTFDDNVHPQNSFMLMSELIRQGKQFDSEFYPNKNHSIYGGNTRFHLFTRITDFILEKL